MNKKVMSVVAVIIAILLGTTIYMNTMGKNKENLDNGNTINIVHRFGETQVGKNPERIVVLDYGTLDILDNLGIDIVGLPKSSLPKYLAKYEDEKYADLGGLKEFSFEKINELKPDLIIIEGRQEDSYEKLSEIAPTIGLGTDGTKYFESLQKNSEIIGEIFDKNEEVKKELEKVYSKVEELGKEVKGLNKNALITMVSGGNISVFGSESRFGMIHKEFGFGVADINIESGNHGENISYEYLLEKNPDYLFVVDKGAIVAAGEKPAKEIVENALVKESKAYKESNIVYLDPHSWYIGGAGFTAANNMIKEVQESL